MKKLIYILIIPLLLITSCLGKSEQQKQVEAIQAKDEKLSQYILKIDKDGDNAYIDILEVKEQAVPAVAIRFVLITSELFRDIEYKHFYLRYKGQDKIFFKKDELEAVTLNWDKKEKPLPTIVNLTRIAKTPGRDVASAFPKIGGGILGMTQAIKNIALFGEKWFVNDVKKEFQIKRDKSATDLGDGL
ncbi:MAG: hypothetical protein GY909_15940 [Oligoflexia bacterium]|nr:hypothetical protein [Oligoflexia bacterium]